MAEREVGHDAVVGNKIIRVQIAQRRRLHRAAQKQRRGFDPFRQIGDDEFAHGLAERTVENQAERAFRIVLADEDDGALKIGAAELAAVEKQLAPQ